MIQVAFVSNSFTKVPPGGLGLNKSRKIEFPDCFILIHFDQMFGQRSAWVPLMRCDDGEFFFWFGPNQKKEIVLLLCAHVWGSDVKIRN